MIGNRKEYFEFISLECGFTVGSYFISNLIRTYFQLQPIKRFLLLLRTCEYYKNCKTGYLNNGVYYVLKYLKFKLGLKLGFSIPEFVFDKGLQIPHYGTIVINAKTRIGKNCRIHACTNLGTSGGGQEAPVLGDNIYIGPGAKIYGGVIISSNIAIAANAAVSKSFKQEHKVIGGIPAKVIGDVNIKLLIPKII